MSDSGGPPTGPQDPEQPDGRPSGSHRAASGPGTPSPLRAAAPALVALAAAAALFVAVSRWLSGGATEAADVLPPAGDTAITTNSPGADWETSSPPTKSTKPSPSKSSKPSPTKSAKPSPTKTTKTPVPAAKAPVVVFNQTTVSGLAARFAARLQDAGWTVTGVANWQGTVPSTTVYYWPGDKRAARALMADFPDVGRIHAAVSPMPRGELSVILCSDFPTT